MSQFDQSNSYYGGGGGGGYLPGGSPFSASGSPGGGRRTEISHSLRPFTIMQLDKASQAHTDAEWRVDDAEIGQVTIVGQVISIQIQPTNCVYSIDDGTGRIEARHWIGEEEGSKWTGIEEGKHVRVTGTLKSFGKKRSITVSHIRNVKDPHEVYFHILEAIAVNLIIERGPPSNPSLALQPKTADAGSGGTSAYYAAQTNSASVNDQYSHLPNLQRAIVKFIIDQKPRAEGVHVGIIAKAIAGSDVDGNKISAALDKLMDDGHVYATIDDSHFNVSL